MKLTKRQDFFSGWNQNLLIKIYCFTYVTDFVFYLEKDYVIIDNCKNKKNSKKLYKI